MAKPRRPKERTFDPNHIETTIYNNTSGGQKNLSTGPLLEPIKIDDSTYTCDATIVKQIPEGTVFWIYNNSVSVRTVRFGSVNTITSSGVPGTCYADGTVDIACVPGEYTQLTSSSYNWIIASSADLKVYIMQDDSYIPKEQ